MKMIKDLGIVLSEAFQVQKIGGVDSEGQERHILVKDGLSGDTVLARKYFLSPVGTVEEVLLHPLRDDRLGPQLKMIVGTDPYGSYAFVEEAWDYLENKGYTESSEVDFLNQRITEIWDKVVQFYNSILERLVGHREFKKLILNRKFPLQIDFEVTDYIEDWKAKADLYNQDSIRAFGNENYTIRRVSDNRYSVVILPDSMLDSKDHGSGVREAFQTGRNAVYINFAYIGDGILRLVPDGIVGITGNNPFDIFMNDTMSREGNKLVGMHFIDDL